MQRLAYLVVAVLLALCVRADDPAPAPQLSKPGGAGHALLFRDHILVKKDFKDFPTTDFTFEAWISTSDFCHSGAIVSYSKDSKSPDSSQRVADFNHFVIFDAKNLLACHDFEYIDLIPDNKRISCHSQFNTTANFVERDGTWHHLAVTWTTRDNGRTEIYKDGLLMSSAATGKTEPLVSNGALVIGGEQDCFGGCTDPQQAFYGMMDEVRIWKSVRTQDEILANMRLTSGLEGHKDLVAYWKFNEPDEDTRFVSHLIARDSSGRGNDLALVTLPMASHETIVAKMDDKVQELHTGSLRFKNNLGLKKDTMAMPDKDFTVEFWAKGQSLSETESQSKIAEFISFSSLRTGGDDKQQILLDDAIRIQRYLEDYSFDLESATSTKGAISVHVNSNEHTDSWSPENWIDFDAQWLDNEWHHVAATWEWATGETKVYFDGKPVTAFWKSDKGQMQDRRPSEGGVDAKIAAQTTRSTTGALVLGMDQNCYGGCFSPTTAYDGSLAVVRIWSRVLAQEEIKSNMFRDHPQNGQGLSALYIFSNDGLRQVQGGGLVAVDQSSNKNDLQFRSTPPEYIYSTAPLTTNDGAPLPKPTPGAAGYALALHDRQVVIMPNFKDFPSTALTLEFWMLSVDRCRPGVPFSYAAGTYETLDNAFLLFNYNSWGVGVMEDEGTTGDHLSGVSTTDGTWHHIAVTWDSSSGNVVLYDNGRPVWTVKRAQGKSIPSEGTLIIGREQDCMGGCFDSAEGASGKVDPTEQQAYLSAGPQDFFGLVEEMRLWRVARTPLDILQGIQSDNGGGSAGRSGNLANDPNLVAYWKFDEPGFVVKDHSNHGHDLKITSEPRFEVVKWLANCGNGIVEGDEECDDGDKDDGNGCSSHCTIEPGWECSGSPSYCTRHGAHGGGGGSHPRPPRGGGDSSSPSGGSSSKHAGTSGGAIAAIVIFSILGVVGAAFAFIKRDVILANPHVEAGVDAIRGAVHRVLPGSRPYRNLNIDPEELDVSPEFLEPLPARTAPGHAGAYVPLPFPPARGGV